MAETNRLMGEKMTDRDIKLLEKLLEDFQSHVGHPFCIAYPVIQDGFSIGIYSNKTGELIKSESSYDLESATNKILTPTPTK
jgi:hypothetical protein